MGVVRKVPITEPTDNASTHAASAVSIVQTRPPSRKCSQVPEPSAAGCRNMLHCQSYFTFGASLSAPHPMTRAGASLGQGHNVKRGTPQSPACCKRLLVSCRIPRIGRMRNQVLKLRRHRHVVIHAFG